MLARDAEEAPTAYQAMLHGHRSVCLAHARRVLRDHYLAEDAVQDALLDAWRQRSAYDGHLSSQRSWLLMLTHRRAVDKVRLEHRHRHLVTVDDELVVSFEETEELAWRAVRAAALHRGLARLTPLQREVLVLAYFNGYTQVEIAALVGVPLGTVKTRTFAAQRRLNAMLQQTCTY